MKLKMKSSLLSSYLFVCCSKFFSILNKSNLFEDIVNACLEFHACVLLSNVFGHLKFTSQSKAIIDEWFCWMVSFVALCWINRKEVLAAMGWASSCEHKESKRPRKMVWRFRRIEPTDIATKICSRDNIKQWLDGSENLFNDRYAAVKLSASSRLRIHAVFIYIRKIFKIKWSSKT